MPVSIRTALLACFALVIGAACAAAQAAPPSAFGGAPSASPSAPGPSAAMPSPPPAFGAPQAVALHAPGLVGAFFSWVVDTQQTMQRELAGGVKRLKTGNPFIAAVSLAGLSFLYGVVHALGPGHGKTVISSYVVANEETVRRGVMISFIAAAIQATTAVAVIGSLRDRAQRERLDHQGVVAPARKCELCADRAGRPMAPVRSAARSVAALAGPRPRSPRQAPEVPRSISTIHEHEHSHAFARADHDHDHMTRSWP